MYCGDSTFWDCTHSCVWGSYTVGVQCFLSSMVGVTGSVRLFRWRGGVWADTGSDMHRLQVRKPPNAPLFKQCLRGLWTVHTDGIKGMCEQHEHYREFKFGTLCLQGYRPVLCWQTDEQISFVGFLLQRPMCDHTRLGVNTQPVRGRSGYSIYTCKDFYWNW